MTKKTGFLILSVTFLLLASMALEVQFIGSYWPIVIDGIYSDDEWSGSTHYNYTLNICGGGETSPWSYSRFCPNHPSLDQGHWVDIYFKTTYSYLLICFRLYNEDYNAVNNIVGFGAENDSYSDQLWISFDVNHDGHIGWPSTIWNGDNPGSQPLGYYLQNYTEGGCYDDVKGLAVGTPEGYSGNPTSWKGEKVDSYGFGPEDPTQLNEFHYNQGQGQSFISGPVGDPTYQPPRDKINFDAAFTHTNPVENELGDYTFEFAIPLRGDKYNGIPVDLDNEPGDVTNMGIIFSYFDATVYKWHPNGEIIINNAEMAN
jgi:hypothetical protein